MKGCAGTSVWFNEHFCLSENLVAFSVLECFVEQLLHNLFKPLELFSYRGPLCLRYCPVIPSVCKHQTCHLCIFSFLHKTKNTAVVNALCINVEIGRAHV